MTDPTRAPILCLSRSLWSEERRAHKNRYQVLSRLARDRTVLMLERPFELASLARPSAAKLRQAVDTFAVARHWPEGIVTLRPLAWWLRDGGDLTWRLNRALYRPWLRRALRRLEAPPILWVYDSRFWPMLEPDQPAVYHCTDDYVGMAVRAHDRATAAWVAEQERALLDRVDLVFAVSEGLAEQKRAPHRDVRVLRSGVDLDSYRPDAPAPPLGVPRPRFGYVGEINYRLDFELLDRVAERFPHGSLVLIGGEAGVAADPAFRRLASRPNVHRLGHRHPKELAGLIGQLDVCLIPFILDDWFVRAAQPLKLFEYLACGRPVVSTWLPNLTAWSDSVALCRSHAEFLDACAAAPRDDAPARARRLAAARENGWEARLAEVSAALAALVSPRADPGTRAASPR
jgi:glycosyltransferase involved in cell wall biosynthesis